MPTECFKFPFRAQLHLVKRNIAFTWIQFHWNINILIYFVRAQWQHLISALNAGSLHNRTPDSHPVSWARMHGWPHNWMWVFNVLGLFFWNFLWVFVQPGTGRCPVDWCRNWMSVLYMLNCIQIRLQLSNGYWCNSMGQCWVNQERKWTTVTSILSVDIWEVCFSTVYHSSLLLLLLQSTSNPNHNLAKGSCIIL